MTLFKPELAELLEITRLNADSLELICTRDAEGNHYTINSVTYGGNTIGSELIESSEGWKDMDAAYEFHEAVARTETVFTHCLALKEGIYKIMIRNSKSD